MRRNVGVGEDRQFTSRLRGDCCALDILVIPETNVDGWVAHSLEQLSAGVLVEHALAECAELLPFITPILDGRGQRECRSTVILLTMNCLLRIAVGKLP